MARGDRAGQRDVWCHLQGGCLGVCFDQLERHVNLGVAALIGKTELSRRLEPSHVGAGPWDPYRIGHVDVRIAKGDQAPEMWGEVGGARKDIELRVGIRIGAGSCRVQPVEVRRPEERIERRSPRVGSRSPSHS